MGPNGAGKTTLLSVISGQYKPDRGMIKFQGDDISGLPPHEICRLGISRTYQIPQPFGKMTTLENVAVAAMYGKSMGKAAAMAKGEEILDIVALSNKRDVPARIWGPSPSKDLSWGELWQTNQRFCSLMKWRQV